MVVTANEPQVQVPARIPKVNVYLQDDVKTDLEKLANAERRSLSQMAAILIEQGIQRAKADGKIPLNPPQTE
jgi:hypothetical protein